MIFISFQLFSNRESVLKVKQADKNENRFFLLFVILYGPVFCNTLPAKY